jgi:hypothetical protein
LPEEELVVYNLNWKPGTTEVEDGENIYNGVFAKSGSSLVAWNYGNKLYLLPPGTPESISVYNIGNNNNRKVDTLTQKESINNNDYFVYELPLMGNGRSVYSSLKFVDEDNPTNYATIEISHLSSSGASYNEAITSTAVSPETMTTDELQNPTVTTLLRVSSDKPENIENKYKGITLKGTATFTDNSTQSFNLAYDAIVSEGSDYKIIRYTGTINLTGKSFSDGTNRIRVNVSRNDLNSTTYFTVTKSSIINLCLKPDSSQSSQWSTDGDSNALGAYTKATFSATKDNRVAKFWLYYKDESTEESVTSSPNQGTIWTGTEDPIEITVPEDGTTVVFTCNGTTVELGLIDIREVVTLKCEPTTAEYVEGTPVKVRVYATNSKGNDVAVYDGKYTYTIEAGKYVDIEYSEAGTIVFETVNKYYASDTATSKTTIQAKVIISKNTDITVIPTPSNDTIELNWDEGDTATQTIQVQLGENGTYSIT